MAVSRRGCSVLFVTVLLGGCGRLGYSAFEREAPSPDGGGTLTFDGALTVSDAGGPDGATPDSAVPSDAGGFDSSATDGGGADAGAIDGGAPDAGTCGPLDALVVSFSFNEGAGPVANDGSGFGNDGSLMGGPTWVAGAEGSGLRFDGTNDEVNAGSAPAIDDLTTFTACAWVFPEGYPNAYPAIADKSRDTFTGGWNFYLENDRTFGLLTNRRRWATGGTVVLNTWQHLCVSWDGTGGLAGIVLYYNGTSVPRSNSGNNGPGIDSDASRDLLIGRVNNGTFPFQGVIDDFRLYGRVLSPAEIAAIRGCANP